MFNIKRHFESWWEYVDPYMIQKLVDNLKKEYDENTVYPSKENVFRAFRETPLDTVETIFIGMDPYINEYKGIPSACGLSFVTENGYVNPSLRILCKVLNIEPKNFKEFVLSKNALMLNTALTVIRGNTGSHLKLWKDFSEQFIIRLSEHKNLNWILLGKEAEKLEPLIKSGIILKAPHPMAYQYSGKTNYSELEFIFKQLKWI